MLDEIYGPIINSVKLNHPPFYVLTLFEIMILL